MQVTPSCEAGQVGHQLYGGDVSLAGLEEPSGLAVRPLNRGQELDTLENRVCAGLAFDAELQLHRRIGLGPRPRIKVKHALACHGLILRNGERATISRLTQLSDIPSEASAVWNDGELDGSAIPKGLCPPAQQPSPRGYPGLASVRVWDSALEFPKGNAASPDISHLTPRRSAAKPQPRPNRA